MSYNGIGLKSAKGSSTSGYVQRNTGDSQARKTGKSEGKQYYKRQLDLKYNERVSKQKKVSALSLDQAILDHEEKREIEVLVMQYRDELENDDDLSDDKIEELLKEFRVKLRHRRQFQKDRDNRRKQDFSYKKTMNPYQGSNKNTTRQTDDDQVKEKKGVEADERGDGEEDGE